MQALKQILESRNLVVVLMVASGFVLALHGKDLPPNLTRVADVALGGVLGLAAPFAVNKAERRRDSNPE